MNYDKTKNRIFIQVLNYGCLQVRGKQEFISFHITWGAEVKV